MVSSSVYLNGACCKAASSQYPLASHVYKGVATAGAHDVRGRGAMKQYRRALVSCRRGCDGDSQCDRT